MDKGANLYGFGYSGGSGRVIGEADAYDKIMQKVELVEVYNGY